MHPEAAARNIGKQDCCWMHQEAADIQWIRIYDVHFEEITFSLKFRTEIFGISTSV
jgi:hypothetical protein